MFPWLYTTDGGGKHIWPLYLSIYLSAVLAGKVVAVELLLAAGADVTIAENDGEHVEIFRFESCLQAEPN